MTRPAKMYLMSSREDRRDKMNRMEYPRYREHMSDRYPRYREEYPRYRMDDRMDDYYPMYRGADYRMDDRMDDRMDYRMDDYMDDNQIGFRDHDKTYVGDPMHGKREKMMGHASSEETLDKRTAKRWMDNIQNADGTSGAHWTMEQTNRVMQQKGLDYEPVEFWAAMNATYSDLCKVSAKHGVDNIDYYVDLACAFWLKDRDAVENKLMTYYEYVVKH